MRVALKFLSNQDLRSAVMSPEYLRSIRTGRPACGQLKILRSRPFDIIDQDARQEFLRNMVAIRRYFIHRP